MRKRTASEQAKAVQRDRRARYEAKMRAEGFKKTSVWVREDRLPEVKAFIEKVNAEPL